MVAIFRYLGWWKHAIKLSATVLLMRDPSSQWVDTVAIILAADFNCEEANAVKAQFQDNSHILFTHIIHRLLACSNLWCLLGPANDSHGHFLTFPAFMSFLRRTTLTILMCPLIALTSCKPSIFQLTSPLRVKWSNTFKPGMQRRFRSR